MATDSSGKLTKFTSSKTIVTADFANTLFGGLYGSSEGDSLSQNDPRIIGHIHDGKRSDGHAPKINLVSNVTDKLTNSNLADDAVTKRNIASFTNISSAIPVSEVIDGVTYYYLNLDGSFEEYDISANGGTVSGDGAGTIVANSSGDIIGIISGSGIDLKTDLTNNNLTISSTGVQKLFDTISTGNTGSGTSSGGPLTADSLTDTLKFTANNGIDIKLSDSSGIDEVIIQNIASNFKNIELDTASGEGEVTGSEPVSATTIDDNLILRAGYGISLHGDPPTNIIRIRNQYSMSHNVQSVNDWINGNISSGWGSITTHHYTDSDSDRLSYDYKLANDDDYVYLMSPIPQNSYNKNPTSFTFRAYFLVVDETPANPYIAAINPDPSFSVDLEVGSSENEADPTDKGTISDDQDITASTLNVWTTALNRVSTPVTGPNKLYILSWNEIDLASGANNLGLLQVRMIGALNFDTHFSGATNTAEVRFLKSDLIWHF